MVLLDSFNLNLVDRGWDMVGIEKASGSQDDPLAQGYLSPGY
jgi:hypothetical protein